MSELYLAQWHFNPRLRPVQGAMADSQALHRLVMSAFPHADSDAARQAFGILYRLEIDEQTGVPALLLQSTARPDWSPLAPFLLRPPDQEPKDVSAIYEAIAVGSVLRFRLRANPTRRINASHAGERMAGKRVNLRTDEQRQAWITRKLTDAGCQLGGCTIQEDARQRGRRDGQQISHHAVLYDGLLRVNDADALRAGIREGIGAGKAYGFGLLSLAPGEQ